MPDLLLTDIDGTLVDSNALHAWSQIVKGGDQLIPGFVPEADRERLEKPLTEFRKVIFHRDYMPRMVAFPQARELLLRVRTSGMKIALATSSEKADLSVYGKLVGMEDLVDEASSSADAKASKPEADIFAAALQKLDMRTEQAVALGDTPWDAQAAGKLGIPVIGLTSGGWKADDLRAAGCVEMWKDPADLLLHFDDSALRR